MFSNDKGGQNDEPRWMDGRMDGRMDRRERGMDCGRHPCDSRVSRRYHETVKKIKFKKHAAGLTKMAKNSNLKKERRYYAN
jgi:hypothetical protein